MIIENIETFENFRKEIEGKEVVVLPTFSDSVQHYSQSELLMLGITNLENKNFFVLPFGHEEAKSLPRNIINELCPRKMWTINKKHLLPYFNSDIIEDATMYYYLQNNTTPSWQLETPAHIYFRRKFNNMININKIIPLMKHIEIDQFNTDKIIEIVGNFLDFEEYKKYSKYGGIVYSIERIGIKVDPIILQKYYGEEVSRFINRENKVYSDYNFYTSTGRPSNSFGNINFAAINKKDGSRQAFIPQNDQFFMIDFDSFHLHLISRIIKFKFAEKNLHSYLGKYYFGKETLDDWEYDEAKKLNFKYLYGGIPRDIREAIPFFAEVNKYVYEMWKEVNKVGYYESPLTKRKIFLDKIESPNATKVFNYFLQLIETEANFAMIERIIEVLKPYKTKLLLYTYDSFLFDHSIEDGEDAIAKINDIIKVFPFKVFKGKNYGDMKILNNIFEL